MKTFSMTTEQLTAWGMLIGAVCAGITGVVTAYFRSRASARVSEIEAQSKLNEVELATMREKNDELCSRVSTIERHHAECMDLHHQCERRCALLEGKISVLEARVGHAEG